MEQNQNLLDADLQIDSVAHGYLAETAKWANFLSIVGFVVSGLMAIAAIFIGTLLNERSGYGYGAYAQIGAGFITAIYLIIAAIGFFASYYLNKFAVRMKAALTANDQNAMNDSFANLKSLFKLWGILTIIYLAFIVLGILVSIGGSI